MHKEKVFWVGCLGFGRQPACEENQSGEVLGHALPDGVTLALYEVYPVYIQPQTQFRSTAVKRKLILKEAAEKENIYPYNNFMSENRMLAHIYFPNIYK
jgi:hypothetical protein